MEKEKENENENKKNVGQSPRRMGRCAPPTLFDLHFTGGGPGYARAASTGAPLRFGFTLIELLVVVLIIGILAAVALPQYKKAVQKTKVANMMAILKTVGKAEQAYFLANGEYTQDIESLAIEPTATSFNNADWGPLSVDLRIDTAPDIETKAKFISSNVYLIYQLSDDKFYCGERRGTNKCVKILGGIDKITDPTDNRFDMFFLPR